MQLEELTPEQAAWRARLTRLEMVDWVQKSGRPLIQCSSVAPKSLRSPQSDRLAREGLELCGTE